jgi:hypothetical protein
VRFETQNGGGSPAVTSTAVVVTDGDTLSAYSANGSTGCSGAPRVCAPLWSASGQGAPLVSPYREEIVVRTAGNGIAAYDSKGIDHCGGTPKVCTPLWQGVVPGTGATDPIAATLDWPDGTQRQLVFMASSAGIFAFDARHETNCGTVTPGWCAPVAAYQATFGGTTDFLAVGGGMLVAQSNLKLVAYSAASPSCTVNAPCAPRWTATAQGPFVIGNGLVYGWTAPGVMGAFDAQGVSSCTGTAPKTCTPRWTYDGGGSIVTAGGVLLSSTGPAVTSYDANGVTGCSGTPKVCQAIASTPVDVYTTSAEPALSNGVVYASGGFRYDALYGLTLPPSS